MLRVGQLVVRELQLGVRIRLDRLRLRGDRRQVRVALGELRLQTRECQLCLLLLRLERRQPLMLPRLLLCTCASDRRACSDTPRAPARR